MDQMEGGTASIDIVVPHQASHLSMAHIAKKLDFPESKIVDIYATHGNQVAASIPTALHEAVMSGRAKKGSRVLMLGTAAGLTLGGLVLDL
jgi:3-oxoacyl-[acyl-carrier-protein] synthase-3